MPQGEETYRSSFGPLVRLRYGWWLIFFFDAALFAGEVDSAKCGLSAAWFLSASRLRLRCWGCDCGRIPVAGWQASLKASLLRDAVAVTLWRDSGTLTARDERERRGTLSGWQG